MKPPKMYLLFAEQWALVDPRNLRALVDLAAQAEMAGIDGIMIGGHVVMGENSAINGVSLNPREFLHIGNHPPMYPHPDNLMLLSAIAAGTTTLKLMAGAVATPLRHPLLLAKEFATLDLLSRGRLIVIPNVSWQREEYEALGVAWERRGKILDEQLEIWQRLWHNGSPVSNEGEFFKFRNVYVEPSPWSSSGPELWFGGDGFSQRLVRRTVRYGKGCWPIKPLTPEEMSILRQAMEQAGRNFDELDFGAVLRAGSFQKADDLLDLDASLATSPPLYARGVTTFLLKPDMFIRDISEFGDFCRTVVRKIKSLSS